MRISIVVTSASRDRLPSLLKLRDSIAQQLSTDLETVIVVERSRQLKEDLEQAVADSAGLKIVFTPDLLGANGSRNLGIASSTGEIVALLDDDAFLGPGWSVSIQKAYCNPSVIGVTGPILPVWGAAVPSWWPPELDWAVGCTRWTGIQQRQEVRSVFGTNASFRRWVLLASPLDVSLGPRAHSYYNRNEWSELGEETEFSLRAKERTGGIIIYDPNVLVYHEVQEFKLSLTYIAQRAYQVGRTKKLIRRRGNYSKEDLVGPETALLQRMLARVAKPWLWKGHPLGYIRGLLYIFVSVMLAGMGFGLPR